jgi:hypothetical protein
MKKDIDIYFLEPGEGFEPTYKRSAAARLSLSATPALGVLPLSSFIRINFSANDSASSLPMENNITVWNIFF